MKGTKKPLKQQSLNVIIPLVVYPFEIMFSAGQDEPEFIDACSNFGVDYDDSLLLQANCLGRATLFTCNRSIIRIKNVPKTANEHGVLAHEIFHIVDFYMGRIGMKLHKSSFEAYAYLLGYITEHIYKSLGF